MVMKLITISRSATLHIPMFEDKKQDMVSEIILLSFSGQNMF
jgi:hypothetical protein